MGDKKKFTLFVYTKCHGHHRSGFGLGKLHQKQSKSTHWVTMQLLIDKEGEILHMLSLLLYHMHPYPVPVLGDNQGLDNKRCS